MRTEIVCDRLRALIKSTGIKAATAAREAGLNESAVRDILRGRSLNPGIETLDKIAGAFGITLEELIRGPDGVGALWRHKRSGGVYRVMAYATRESDLVPVIVYEPEPPQGGPVWVRPSAEFFDGRFALFTEPAAGREDAA